MLHNSSGPLKHVKQKPNSVLLCKIAKMPSRVILILTDKVMWLLIYICVNIFLCISKKIPDFSCVSSLRFNFGCDNYKEKFLCVLSNDLLLIRNVIQHIEGYVWLYCASC
jgi:hypothetical protein